MAYAVAQQLGFRRTEVAVDGRSVQLLLRAGRRRSSTSTSTRSRSRPSAPSTWTSATPYFTAPQAVVAPKGSPAASATSLAELANAKLGVQVGTTSLDAVNASIKPKTQPQVFNDSNDTVRALKGSRVDAIVVDLPTAFYLTAAQVPAAKIVGQFAAPGGDRWGMLLEKGSKLTTCVNQALAKLSSRGELKQLQDQWMGGTRPLSCTERLTDHRRPTRRARDGAAPASAP